MKMKKTLSGTATLAILCTLASCSSAGDNAGKAAASQAHTAASSKNTHPTSTKAPAPKRSNANKTIYLTFDDGPAADTPQYLKILKDNDAVGTFFLIGRQIPTFQQAVKQENAQGMSVQVHTWDHIHTYPTLSDAEITRQVMSTANLIKKATGVNPTCVRPPEGATNLRVKKVLANLGFKQMLWTDDSEDWERPGVKTILHNALSEASNNGIIIMHDGGGNRRQTMAALPILIKDLRNRGYAFGTLCGGSAQAPIPKATANPPTAKTKHE